MTSKDLRESLDRLPLSALQVRVEGAAPKIIGIVASPDFEGQNEAARQRLIWEHLLANLSPVARAEIEFVFTFTPKELEALGRSARIAQ